MHRAFVNRLSEDLVDLEAEESHHLVKVLRVRKGERFLGLDGKGGVFVCRLHRTDTGWVGEILEETEDEQAESSCVITLAQSLIKKDRFEWVLQKAVELGVARVAPIVSWRTEVRPDGKSLEHRMTRWNRILEEAVKQSQRTRRPILDPLLSLGDFLGKKLIQPCFRLDEQGGLPLRDYLQEHRTARQLLFFVGPEGGWDDRDRSLFEKHAVPAVHLGHRILRTETAPVTVLAILQYELGGFQ
jgi:16S rRNA (uracil1498-N3)-methyltransferase